MKQILTAILLCLVFMIPVSAQENPVNHGLGLGMQLNQYGGDFGFGLNLTTPFFNHQKMAVRFRANYMFYEHVKDEEFTWTPYFSFTAGLVSGAGFAADRIRLYGEGGVVGLMPSDEFSGESFVFGGYGLFGFEFFLYRGFNYFIELGGIGTGATADKIAAKPIYSNGFMISTGFRAQFE